MAHLVRHVRRHWKKYAFGTLGLYLGSRYFAKRFRETLVIREYCHRAKVYGELHTSGYGIDQMRKVVVFLNPLANKREAKIQFLKYAAPLLHLAGMNVTIVESEYEGQIRTLLGYIDPTTDTIVVAGGDGTLLEVVNGLMRRYDAKRNKTIPIGVIPLGKENRFYKQQLSPLKTHKSIARIIGEATMDVIEGNTVPMHLMEVQPEKGRNLYALSSMEWGAFKDAYENRNSFRLFGKLRIFFSYLNTALRRWPDDYTLHVWLPPTAVAVSDEDGMKPPGRSPLLLEPWKTSGESKPSFNVRGRGNNYVWGNLMSGFNQAQCISKSPLTELHPGKKETGASASAHGNSDPSRVTSLAQRADMSGGQWRHKQLGVVGFKVQQRQCEALPGQCGLGLHIWPSTTEKGTFIRQGWATGFGRKDAAASLLRFSFVTPQLILQPHSHRPSWVSVDGEPFEAMPVALRLLPDALRMYTQRGSGN